MQLLYLPLTLYVFFIGSFRTGKLFYFAAANPKIPLGGFADDSKFLITEHIPSAFKPKTILISKCTSAEQLLELIHKAFLQFPLFGKPDLGEGGFLAKKLRTKEELLQYHASHNMDYLLQEFITYPLELSLLVHTAKGFFEISSITERQHLSIVGDGISTLKSLLIAHPRAKFRLDKVLKQCAGELENIPAINEVVKPTSIGNWDCGATYIERTEFITADLVKVFEKVNQDIQLFNYARYDIMCESFDELCKGRFKILEINGVKGEPIHLYDDQYTLRGAYREIFKHWEYILKISQRNMLAGFVCPSPLAGFKMLRHHAITKKSSIIKRP